MLARIRITARNSIAFYLLIALTLIMTCGQARATVTSFSGIWDPTNSANGFVLSAADPHGSATIVLTEQNAVMTVTFALNGCYTGCGAFSLSNSGVLGNLPFGAITFDWSLQINQFTTDGQIDISGADQTVNSGARDTWLFPGTFDGSATLDYQGGPIVFFNVGLGAHDTGSTTAMLQINNFSAPSPPAFANLGNGPVTTVTEPGGALLLLFGLAGIGWARRRV